MISRRDEATPGRPSVPHGLQEQEDLWAEFLAMARSVVDSLEKAIAALRDGRLDVIAEVKDAERASDREEVRIEQECLRVLALYEPVASDLRRLATILKVSRDCERIADLSARIARRARKFARKSPDLPIPDALLTLAADVLELVREVQDALDGRDSRRARDLLLAHRPIRRQYRRLRKSLRSQIQQDPGRLDAWLQLLGTARNLERIADHAIDIAEMVVFLEEGISIRHAIETPPSPK